MKRLFTSKLTRQSLLSIFTDDIFSTKVYRVIHKGTGPSKEWCQDSRELLGKTIGWGTNSADNGSKWDVCLMDLG